MKCPACHQEIKLTLPPGLSKKTEAICPKCNARLNWERDWKKGIIIAIAGAGLFYALSVFVFHNLYGLILPLAGGIIGLFVGSRKLVKV